MRFGTGPLDSPIVVDPQHQNYCPLPIHKYVQLILCLFPILRTLTLTLCHLLQSLLWRLIRPRHRAPPGSIQLC